MPLGRRLAAVLAKVIRGEICWVPELRAISFPVETSAQRDQLPRRAQVGHIAYAESKDELAPLFGELAQLAGPEEAARQDTRLLSDITKVPSPRQFPDADRH